MDGEARFFDGVGDRDGGGDGDESNGGGALRLPAKTGLRSVAFVTIADKLCGSTATADAAAADTIAGAGAVAAAAADTAAAAAAAAATGASAAAADNVQPFYTGPHSVWHPSVVSSFPFIAQSKSVACI